MATTYNNLLTTAPVTDGGVFFAEYGVTTGLEIAGAFANNKMVFLKVPTSTTNDYYAIYNFIAKSGSGGHIYYYFQRTFTSYDIATKGNRTKTETKYISMSDTSASWHEYTTTDEVDVLIINQYDYYTKDPSTGLPVSFTTQGFIDMWNAINGSINKKPIIMVTEPTSTHNTNYYYFDRGYYSENLTGGIIRFFGREYVITFNQDGTVEYNSYWIRS